MAVSNIKAEFSADVKKVWEIVTSLENYSWRSVITAFEPCKRYEFDMENNNMRGHWTGIFLYENGVTTIDFTENVEAKKIFMKPFVKGYLRKQQAAYIEDLRKALA